MAFHPLEQLAAKILSFDDIPGNSVIEKLPSAQAQAKAALDRHGISTVINEQAATTGLEVATQWVQENEADFVNLFQEIITGSLLGNEALGSGDLLHLTKSQAIALVTSAYSMAAVGVPIYSSGYYQTLMSTGDPRYTEAAFAEDAFRRLMVLAAIVEMEKLGILSSITTTPATAPSISQSPVAVSEGLLVVAVVIIAAVMWVTIILGIVGLVGAFSSFYSICKDAQSTGNGQLVNRCVELLGQVITRPDPGATALTTLAVIGGLAAAAYFLLPVIADVWRAPPRPQAAE